jgi:signal transduction histidine kinase
MVASTVVGFSSSSWAVSHPAQRVWHRPPPETLLPLAFYALVAFVLAAAGYPGWRIAVMAVAVVVPQAALLALKMVRGARRDEPKQCLNRDPDRVAWWAVLSQSALFISTGVSTAITGGVGSPLLVTMIAPYFGVAVVAGDRRQTRCVLCAIGLAVGALAVLPRGITGPELPGSVRLALLVGSVVGIGALLAPVHAWMRMWRADFARAREEMASDALARAQTLEQVGSKVAHELKNPLTGVKALVQLGLRNPAEARSHERLEVVEREVTRMQEILQNYLSFNRPLQGMVPRRLALGPLVSDTLVVLAARANESRVRLYAEGDATIEADPRRLKEALLNLVANAIEATPPGGEVFVSVRPAGDEIEILVRDTGRGMPPETLIRLGTPFFTTRDGGTGLGVVLARSAIAQHGGSLRYESEPGRGTRAKVTLPRLTTGDGDAARAARR